MTGVWMLEMSARLFGLPKTSWLIWIGMLVSSLVIVTLWLIWQDDRASYLELPRGHYHPSFFLEYDLARRNHAGWLTDPYIVAQKYAGITNLCPVGTVQQLFAEPGRVIYIFTNKCWGGIFAARKYRVDLIETQGVWEIEWSGVQFKCSQNPSDPGSVLLTLNPLRKVRNPLGLGFNNGVKSLAFNLNPWHTQCP